MKIACDIGGCVKNMINDDPIEGAIDSLISLSENNEIVFISKCKESYQAIINEWLSHHQLNHKIYFCESYDDKANIANELGINAIIDDKLSVLRSFNDKNSTKLIWFCNDQKKISGAMKYQPELFKKIIVCKNWTEILLIFIPINTVDQ